MMDRDNYKLFEQKLTESAVSEIEDLMQIDQLRNDPKLKRSLALMVVLTYETNTGEPFFEFHERLVTLFRSVTSVDQGEERRVFGRPIIRKKEGQISADMSERCLCTWMNEGVSVDIPVSYMEGFKSAILYLTVSDIQFFSYRCPPAAATSAIEIPCFLEMFLRSSLNNQNNFAALTGEYVALNGMCFEKGYIGKDFKYSCLEQKFDFAVHNGTIKTSVSVKSVKFSTGKHFESPRSSDVWNSKRDCKTAKFVRQSEGKNVLLHNCDCRHCALQPLRRITVQQSMIVDENRVFLGDLECECKATLEEAFAKWLPRDSFRISDSGSNSEGDEDSDDSLEETEAIQHGSWIDTHLKQQQQKNKKQKQLKQQNNNKNLYQQ
ncbi:hypothetical protein BOX15_Mlig020718g1 [Macrostomum lignano]|uniref:Uncharacterized protein n=1 Tax=Macrostomum lignano TaxID=282301 RepID=A0A267H5C5_9PLAT|nr:hypothetical protein BOX15_Mlig020718g1 [Macrostomum lignano]